MVRAPEAGGATPAWEQIKNKAVADGWTALYDPTNPNTRTLNGSDVSAVADALGNWSDLVQATAIDQPAHVVGQWGDLDAMQNASASGQMASASANAGLAQSFYMIQIVRPTSGGSGFGRLWGGADTNPHAHRNNATHFNWAMSTSTISTPADSFAFDTDYVIGYFANAAGGSTDEIYINSGTAAVTGDVGNTAFPTEFRLMNRLSADRALFGHFGLFLVGAPSGGATDFEEMRSLIHTLSGITTA